MQISENLRKQREELQRKVTTLAGGGVSEAQLAARRSELAGAERSLSDLEQQVAQAEGELQELASTVGGLWRVGLLHGLMWYVLLWLNAWGCGGENAWG